MSTDVSLRFSLVLTVLRCGNPGAKPQFNIWASAGTFFPLAHTSEQSTIWTNVHLKPSGGSSCMHLIKTVSTA